MAIKELTDKVGVSAKFKERHIDYLVSGDTIWYNGEIRTVCEKDIKRGGFCGTTVFGDSLRGGTIPTLVLIAFL